MIEKIYIKRSIDDVLKKVITRSSSQIDFLNGKAGIALFLSEYMNCYPNPDLNIKLNSVLDEIRINIEQFPIAMNFANGLSGIVSVYNIIRKITANEIFTIESEIDELMFHSFIKIINKGEYELFFGGLGYVMYFLNRPTFISQKYLTAMIKLILEESIQSESGIYWKSYYKELYDKDFINLGLSHGMAAIPSLLSLIPDENMPELISRNQIVEEICLFYKSNMNDSKKYNSLFPYGITKKTEEKNSRLAWCYGDVGIGISFLNVGLKMNNLEIEQFGKEILFHSCFRKNIKGNGVVDPYFCHGSSGLAIIFLNAYKKTGDTLFKESAFYWLKVTLSLLKTEKYSNSGFLMGLSGIGLVLLSFLSEDHLLWERLVLLD